MRTEPGPPPTKTTLVWDVPTRLFHWGLVGCVSAALATALLAPASWLNVHVMAGYGIALLVVFRIIWGISGGPYSRFRTLPLAPKRVWGHIRGLMAGRSPETIGHTPAGAWMILFLLVTLTALTVSGLVVLGGQENLGPLAAFFDFKAGHAIAEVHEGLAFALMGAIGIHIAAVLVETRVFKHPLISAMITGRKPVSAPMMANMQGKSGLYVRRGLALFSVSAIVLTLPTAAMTTLPPSGWHPVAVNPTYQAACSECHDAHHPSLRTAGDWTTLMAGLSDHFGEDASISPAKAEDITRFLQANSADAFDTEVANVVGHAHTPSGRITDSPAWKKRHRDISPDLFKSRKVGSPVNCQACHSDAATGRFDDQAIAPPKGDPS